MTTGTGIAILSVWLAFSTAILSAAIENVNPYLEIAGIASFFFILYDAVRFLICRPWRRLS